MIIFQPITVATNSQDEEGHLAILDGKLVAVLVRLSGKEHMDECGRLYLEAGFGRLPATGVATFATLDDAAHWLEAELGARAVPTDGDVRPRAS